MRKRDYQQEYQARQSRARSKGFSGYGQQRGFRVKANEWATEVAERMTETGLMDIGIWEDENFEDLLEHESEFWEVFRNAYGKGQTA